MKNNSLIKVTNVSDDRLEAAILLAILPPTFIKDFYIKKKGIHYRFKTDITNIQPQLTAFLSALRETTDLYFYFEAINNREAILKTYGNKRLEFKNNIICQDNSEFIQGGV